MKKHIIGYVAITLFTVLPPVICAIMNHFLDMQEEAAAFYMIALMGLMGVGCIYAGIYIRYMWFMPFTPILSAMLLNLLVNGTVVFDYMPFFGIMLFTFQGMLFWALVSWAFRKVKGCVKNHRSES